jgi:hypothetical protein
VAVWATASNTFWGCQRLGKLLPASRASFSRAYHPTVDVTQKELCLDRGLAGLTYRIPWTKTTKEKGASVILIELGHELCPIRVLEVHKRANRARGPGDPLFGYQAKDSVMLSSLWGWARRR